MYNIECKYTHYKQDIQEFAAIYAEIPFFNEKLLLNLYR